MFHTVDQLAALRPPKLQMYKADYTSAGPSYDPILLRTPEKAATIACNRMFVMRFWLWLIVFASALAGPALAQEDRKTDDLKPADPDTGESTVQETTLGLLPNPFESRGVKFAVTYIGEGLGNSSGGLKRGAVYEDRFNFAVLRKLEDLENSALVDSGR